MPKELDALESSCVVIPCSFTHPHGNLPTSRLKATWYLLNNPDRHIFDEDKEEITETFKDRTKLLGHLGQNNCTLEIKEIKNHDNGPFCLQIGIVQADTQTSPIEPHSFVNNCVQFKILCMLLNIQTSLIYFIFPPLTKATWLVSTFTLCFIADPPKPTVTQPKVAYEDHPYIITCSVTHTCLAPYRRPNLTWSRDEGVEVSEVHRELHFGYWEILSILTFMPDHKDDHSEVTCTAWFDGGRTSSTTRTVYIKRESFSLVSGLLNICWIYVLVTIRMLVCLFIGKESYRYVIIPAVVGTVTAGVVGVVSLFILKKYRCIKHSKRRHGWHQYAYFFILCFQRRRISELQNQAGR